MMAERRLRDPDERRLFARWARNVLAIYGVLIASAFTLLACVPTAQSSGAQTARITTLATSMPVVIELPPRPYP